VKFHKVMLLAFVVLLSFASVSRADMVTSSGYGFVPMANAINVVTLNDPNSSDIASSGLAQPGYNPVFLSFGFSVGGVTLPAGSTINSARLSFDFPVGVFPGFITSSWYVFMNPWNTFDGATFSDVSAVEYGAFVEVTSPHAAAPLFGLPGGTIDLLASGFGPDILVGDSLNLAGLASMNMTWNYDYTGYNAMTYTSMLATTVSQPHADLSVDYTAPVPEPGSLALLVTVLGSLSLCRKLRPWS
jgi:hypothetical protein